MPVIQIVTEINAPAERCFLLSLSVDLHKESANGTSERAVAGITSGIMGLNDSVTWEASHFGIRQRLTSEIPLYSFPHYFVSRMVKGPFRKIYHQHIFHSENGKTKMTDLFDFEAPFGIFGKLAELLFLKNYMKKFLLKRNIFIRQAAESDEWKKFLNQKNESGDEK